MLKQYNVHNPSALSICTGGAGGLSKGLRGLDTVPRYALRLLIGGLNE